MYSLQTDRLADIADRPTGRYIHYRQTDWQIYIYSLQTDRPADILITDRQTDRQIYSLQTDWQVYLLEEEEEEGKKKLTYIRISACPMVTLCG